MTIFQTKGAKHFLRLKNVTRTLLLVGVIAGFIQPVFAAAQIENYTAPGNLEATATLGCITTNKISPQNNPIDLFLASKACISAKK